MNILLVLGLLQLLAGPAPTLSQPTHDYWGEFGASGPCSRTCGTGVAMRTRRCITSRTDGGHNCIGSSKTFRSCNTHECPIGSRNFREEQGSQFDILDFQGKHHSWVPYYGASNPCELNCVPRGENFFYRHGPAVVDGTPCYGGRTDICVDGISRHAGFASRTHPRSRSPRRVLGHLATEGMPYRSVECRASGPQRAPVWCESLTASPSNLQGPQGQQAGKRASEYGTSSFGVCPVTCGEGWQTREVIRVGLGGEHLADRTCSGLARPPSVKACRRAARHTHITWHVTAYGLCTRSCGGGVRERRVGCFDTDLNPYPEARCGLASRPVSVEACNSQPCPGAQSVPSVQDPRAHESTMRGFVPHVPGDSSVSRPQTNIAYEPYPPVVGPHCAQSFYGCCPDWPYLCHRTQERGLLPS
ncbi:LOW QUALITY PROTEIN: papilin b, proteoglycan-like sulfated glycoprotein [Xiphias gladius]|uniref:LOW QUALITY PROTEIN: papilin b, proteoglycan-like sulfated glycoprotein n=1 Tax=Xiphias gladius TaxID=8245 RepID=UPI001A992F38|nr:LOW QUALITY PROTEIN: papilin b, proteoglycan-like sulfated glycoprotein [Xiphias gladius]